jgi:outer membrane lipoprotein SlyB
MKSAIILASICAALLLGGCADQSLMTDEEYTNSRGPAPHAPDFSNVLPQRSSTYNPSGGY